MKATLDPLTNLNRDLDVTRPWQSDEHPAAVLAEEKPGSRCDRWGHPCPGCRKNSAPGNYPDTTFIEPLTSN